MSLSELVVAYEGANTTELSEAAAAALGISLSSFYRARVLVRAANSGDDRAVAAVEEMDRTGKITPPYNAYLGRPSAPSGRRTDDAVPEINPPYRRPQRAQRDAVTSAISTLKGLTLGLESIQSIDPSITCEEAASWERDLSRVLRVLRSVHTKVKEHAHGSP